MAIGNVDISVFNSKLFDPDFFILPLSISLVSNNIEFSLFFKNLKLFLNDSAILNDKNPVYTIFLLVVYFLYPFSFYLLIFSLYKNL